VTVEIDRRPTIGKWGTFEIPVTPGEHEITVSFRYLGRQCGRATTMVVVAKGRTVTLAYCRVFVAGVTSAARASGVATDA
jgi:hypothetical protein